MKDKGGGGGERGERLKRGGGGLFGPLLHVSSSLTMKKSKKASVRLNRVAESLLQSQMIT